MRKPVCDIIILTWNRADLLKPCIERILRYTDVPSRLLIVDNASTQPEVIEFQESLTGTEMVQIEIIRRQKNDGFAKGINAGLDRATAPWICVMNNDVLVTKGWLSELIRVAESNPKIGLLNPMSNEFGIAPKGDETPDDVADRLAAKKGQWTEFWNCVGFCVLMPQKILETVGLLDEKLGYMYFEDADYSLRVRNAGFDCGIAQGAYAFHIGGATANENPHKIEFFETSRKAFLKKWNLPTPQRIALIVHHRDIAAHQESLTRKIRSLANQDHIVWIYCTETLAPHIPNHLNVTTQQLPNIGFYPMAALKILLKKKGFQKIIAPSDRSSTQLIRWVGQIRKVPVEFHEISYFTDHSLKQPRNEHEHSHVN